MAKPSIERLREALSYSPDTGKFHWKVAAGSRAKPGDEAGSIDAVTGYLIIGIDGTLQLGHRLAWAIHHGRWPDDEVDHENRIRSDNRMVNLREATHAQNMKNRNTPKNNTSGLMGVSWHKRAGKWRATLGQKHLGLFDDPAEACAARQAAERSAYGQFARSTA